MDVLRCVDSEAEFKKGRSIILPVHRVPLLCSSLSDLQFLLPPDLHRDIAFQLQRDHMVSALKTNRPICFLPFFKQSLVEKRENELLVTLDHGET